MLPDLDENDYANWAVKSHITEGDFTSLNSDQIREFVADKGLCRFVPGENEVSETSCHVWNESERIISFASEFDFLVTTNDLLDFKPEGFCRHNGFYSPTYRCSRVYRMNDDLLTIIDDDRDGISWYRVVDRDLVLERHRKARYTCENFSKLSGAFARICPG